MTDEPPRLRLVRSRDAADPPGGPVRDAPPPRSERAFVCPECDGRALAEYRFGARIVEGALIGGELWWGCARCLTPHIWIRDL